ncbi:MAG: ribosome assembly cofactor RimP [Paludibacter sp.]
MILKETVSQIVSSYLDGTDYYIAHINVSLDNRIVVEIDAFDGVSLDFCIELNKYIESQFDREVEDFELEVSSAGLTEPFRVLKQYEKNIGNEVEVLTKSGVKIAGILVAANEENFTISREVKVQVEGSKRKVVVDEESTFNYNEIKYTKYIIRFK